MTDEEAKGQESQIGESQEWKLQIIRALSTIDPTIFQREIFHGQTNPDGTLINMTESAANKDEAWRNRIGVIRDWTYADI